MAAPTETVTLDLLSASVASVRRRGLVDAFFGSAPLLAWLRRRVAVTLQGGFNIKTNFIHRGLTSGSFGRGDSFDSAIQSFGSTMTFDWSHNYAAANVSGIDMDLNGGPEQVFDIVDATQENAELSLIDELSTQIQADGTGNGSKDMDGVGNGISRSVSVPYGGITRSTTASSEGAAIRAAVENTTGGPLTLAFVNTDFGGTTIGQERPDLLVMPQVLKNKLWTLSQSSERVAPEDVRDIGFTDLRFNGAAVTVDSHVAAGFIQYFNTKWWTLYVHTNGDFKMRNPGLKTDQYDSINQLIFIGDLVCRSPRMQGIGSGYTVS